MNRTACPFSLTPLCQSRGRKNTATPLVSDDATRELTEGHTLAKQTTNAPTADSGGKAARTDTQTEAARLANERNGMATVTHGSIGA